jgi:hypothetical protein
MCARNRRGPGWVKRWRYFNDITANQIDPSNVAQNDRCLP